jgi:hypothetical protein
MHKEIVSSVLSSSDEYQWRLMMPGYESHAAARRSTARYPEAGLLVIGARDTITSFTTLTIIHFYLSN